MVLGLHSVHACSIFITAKFYAKFEDRDLFHCYLPSPTDLVHAENGTAKHKIAATAKQATVKKFLPSIGTY